MQATKTKAVPRGDGADKKSRPSHAIDIQMRGEDGKTIEVQVPSTTLLKALGWGAAVLIGIEVAKAGARKLSDRKGKPAAKRAAARKTP